MLTIEELRKRIIERAGVVDMVGGEWTCTYIYDALLNIEPHCTYEPIYEPYCTYGPITSKPIYWTDDD